MIPFFMVNTFIKGGIYGKYYKLLKLSSPVWWCENEIKLMTSLSPEISNHGQKNASNVGQLRSWQLVLFGTDIDPLHSDNGNKTTVKSPGDEVNSTLNSESDSNGGSKMLELLSSHACESCYRTCKFNSSLLTDSICSILCNTKVFLLGNSNCKSSVLFIFLG